MFNLPTTRIVTNAPSLLTIFFTVSTTVVADDHKLTEEVIVRAHPLSAEGLVQPVSVLSGEELNKSVSVSLGDTLRSAPGVHSASFGQAVGRPVIRGLGGPRVKLMEDRIDALDVSVSSPDHATTIEPFIAESIEVLKGPSTLLYGNGAIGGVVDVHTGRIPHVIPEATTGKIEVRGADNADHRTAAGRIAGGSENFAFHVDGFYRDADDYDIPGFAESARQRAREEEGHDDHDDHDDHDGHSEEEEAFGTLPGSAMQSKGGAFGLSWVGEKSFVGVAVSTFEAEYGLPGHSHAHHGHDDDHGDDDHDDHGEGAEMPPILDLEQTRIDLEAGFESPFDGSRNMNIRFGYNDYEHTEVEGDEGGTTFATEAWESRIELTHETLLGFDGAVGLQLSDREFSALGAEAFIEPVDTSTWGIFWVGQRNFGETGLELGFRYDNVDQDPSAGKSRSFNLGSASIGLIQPLSDQLTISGQVDYSNRAPIAEELYSNGAHLATQTFEIGNENLSKETATNVSANLRYENETLFLSISAYISDFSDFIYESNTGLEEDELPVLVWTQGDATYRGFELDTSWQALVWDQGALTLKASFDSVTGRLDQGSIRDLPRVPPQRFRLAGTLDWSDFQAEISWEKISDQDDVSLNELQTDGFDDLRLYVSYTKDFGSNRMELFLNGRNLTDDEQRLHTSFIGHLAPQRGRTIELGARLFF